MICAVCFDALEPCDCMCLHQCAACLRYSPKDQPCLNCYAWHADRLSWPAGRRTTTERSMSWNITRPAISRMSWRACAHRWDCQLHVLQPPQRFWVPSSCQSAHVNLQYQTVCYPITLHQATGRD